MDLAGQSYFEPLVAINRMRWDRDAESLNHQLRYLLNRSLRLLPRFYLVQLEPRVERVLLWAALPALLQYQLALLHLNQPDLFEFFAPAVSRIWPSILSVFAFWPLTPRFAPKDHDSNHLSGAAWPEKGQTRLQLVDHRLLAPYSSQRYRSDL